MTDLLELSYVETIVTNAIACANNTSAIEGAFSSEESCGERRFSWWWREDSDSPYTSVYTEIAVYTDVDNIARIRGEKKKTLLIKPCRIEIARRILSTNRLVVQPTPVVFAFRPLTALPLTNGKPDYNLVKLLEREVLASADV